MRWRKMTAGVVFMFVMMVGSGVVSAASQWDQTDVALDHDWTIDFNTELDPATVTEATIYVMNRNGGRVQSDVQLKDGNCSVQVTAPAQGYKKGFTYELIVSDEVKSAEGKPMEKEVVMEFKAKPRQYSQEEIDYFTDIAIGSEWGSTTSPIRKWESDPRIKVFGNPTSQDQATVSSVISELNTLQDEVDLRQVEGDPTIEVYFVPLSDFDKYVQNPQGGNWGLFYYWTKPGYTIYKSKVLIAMDVTTQAERSHLLREELTQTLGLPRDSTEYPDSMFYQAWTTTREYSALDEALIRMLYDYRVTPGMSKEEVGNVFNGK